MNRKIPLGASIAFMLIVAAATFSATMTFAQSYFNQKATDLERSREMYLKFTEVDSTVRENYSGTINEEQLMDSVARGYIAGLGDKYASYLSAEEYKRLLQSREGEDVGIGVVAEISADGYLSVLEVYPDSPAQLAGIVAGDDIIKIGEVNLSSENVGQAAGMLQGEAGTKISLIVRKDGTEDVSIPDLTRRAIAVPSVYARMIPDTKVGYMLIKQFNNHTADQFNRELNKLVEAGAVCLVFDVRDNKGVSITPSVRVLDKLVPAGTVYSLGYKDGTVEESAVSDANEINLPMVVLVNGGTSSAAELFAQNLKDFGKASIVGQTTAGKGVMLNRLKLSDGSAVELTVATLLPRSGVTFDGVGVKPDYDILPEGDWTEQDELSDPQLKKAIELALAMRKVEAQVQAESSASSEASVPQSTPDPTPSSSVSEPESSAEEPDEEEIDGESSDGEDGDEDEAPIDEDADEPEGIYDSDEE